MSDVTARFESLAKEWEAHCAANREASNPYKFITHPSFEALVALGRPAVPLRSQPRHGGLKREAGHNAELQ